MISLETIIVISLLLYLVQKIATFLYSWMKSFYTLNSIIFLVNSYLDSGMTVSKEFEGFKVKSSNKKLVIETKDKDNSLEDIKDRIEEIINTKNKNYKVVAKESVLEITSAEN